MNAAFADIATAASRWRIWFLMGNQEIALRYRRSTLGPFWISLTMLMMVLGIGILYSQIFKVPFKEYVIFISAGLLAWNYLSSLIIESASVVIENEAHFKSLPIPAPIFAAKMAYRNFIIFLHNALVVVVLLLILQSLKATALLALVGVAVYALVGFNLGLILGPLSARFRDIPQLIASVLQLAFFVTPIVWAPKQLSHNHPAITFNPLYHLMQLVREPLLGRLPTAENWAVCAAIVVVLSLAAVASQAFTRKKIFIWL
ncbi:ABC transporter permease [Caulobacter sp. BE254]|uniref:ABC transporter permease n=1 Tax=Caulobacter sp. BE254 TaxID=2817720 RepID=UPI0028674C9F|nr:ABC transporter permease [Caulobacter sp. BE254]MDR7117316.1 ABC-type polysaccharide/polyol phosphate export permease [Caulobacter sp. BE254]